MEIPSVEAVTYGRNVIQREIKRLQDFERQARERDDESAADKWHQTSRWLDWQVLGDGKGCVITAFDARWLDEEFRGMMSKVGEKAHG